jgi:hypothetical protein
MAGLLGRARIARRPTRPASPAPELTPGPAVPTRPHDALPLPVSPTSPPLPRAEPEAFTPGYSSVRLQFLAACTAEEDASVLLPCLRPGMSMVACGSGQGSNIVDTLMQRHRIVFARRPVQGASHGAC